MIVTGAPAFFAAWSATAISSAETTFTSTSAGPADAQRGILRHGGLGHDAIRREIGLNQRLNQGIHQKRKPPEGIDIRIVPYFQKRHKEKQKKTPVSSICRKRADYFCPKQQAVKTAEVGNSEGFIPK